MKFHSTGARSGMSSRLGRDEGHVDIEARPEGTIELLACFFPGERQGIGEDSSQLNLGFLEASKGLSRKKSNPYFLDFSN